MITFYPIELFEIYVKYNNRRCQDVNNGGSKQILNA